MISRIHNKLTGKDFGEAVTLDVQSQVQRLIEQATSHENLCQCYIGWSSFPAAITRSKTRHPSLAPLLHCPTPVCCTLCRAAPGLGEPLPHLHRDLAHKRAPLRSPATGSAGAGARSGDRHCLASCFRKSGSGY